MARAALDANVAIGLAKGEVFDSLLSLYTDLFIPPSVRREVIDLARGRAGAAELQRALGQNLYEIIPDPATIHRFAHLASVADSEVLAVAVDQGVDHLLTADRVIRRQAAAIGILCLTAAQVLVLMKDQGLIAAVTPVLELMQQRGFGIAEGDYRSALTAAGE